MRQEPGQSINSFLSQMSAVWDQLALCEPSWKHSDDAAIFVTFRNSQRVLLFLMALHKNFEPVRASLLHRVPLPTLEQATSELISEETRLGIHTKVLDSVLATPQAPSPVSNTALATPQSKSSGT